MSTDAVPDEITHALAASDRHAYLEQRIFVLSPVGLIPTTIILFVLLSASFALAWSVSGRPGLSAADGRIYIGSMIRLALWFVLMLTTILAMQRYARVKDREALARYAAVLRGGWTSAALMAALTPHRAPLGWANAIGLLIGLGASWLFYVGNGSQNLLAYPAMLAWFTIATTILIMTFTRGVALTRAGTGSMRRIIEDELIIDLLRIDQLNVIGQSAARPALIWFTVSAVIFLLFVGGGLTIFTTALLFACAAMGIWVFVATMEQVHRRIHSTKRAELENVRTRIGALCDAAGHDASAAARLQGLLAYEARIAATPEWPFDQTTLVRVGASALILTVPWFGQAIAAYVVEHMGHI